MPRQKWNISGIVLDEVFSTQNCNCYPLQDIIKFQKSDNGKFYIYLNNTNGQLDKKYCNYFEWLLMIEKLNNNIYEIKGLATEIFGNIRESYIESYDLIWENQHLINAIYNGIDIFSIVGKNKNTDICATYTAEHVFIPKKCFRIFISKSSDINLIQQYTQNCDCVIGLSDIDYKDNAENFIDAQCKDYDRLNKIITNNDLWEEITSVSSLDTNKNNELLKRINEVKQKTI